ncbi:Myosin head, motor domain-containing protein [Rozella allomycis CSF55]|uniref:Myosin head, motor domain-containing protein n=1 Tax=Rozella allomycis (strain CSF55) TaxID=988480 RepID=A0A075ATS2_ROZAC|nr:Myosin head, motor domain-containing protein [Rozella allomycis CSF55]|eukprot:EPZ31952.1 Myosin head, motor domain-containing protein [Rozella allomycis CSF55]
MFGAGSNEEDIDDMTNLTLLTDDSILNALGRLFLLVIVEYVEAYSSARIRDLPPHIYALSQEAYHNLVSTGKCQSMIISGESGSGKTESTKLILEYLSSIMRTNGLSISRKIMEANIVLESFGNAKTVRNHNSSRFGKFIKIHFDDNNVIKGATMQNYLLEKSRISKQAKNERNYHIFYQMLLGCSKEEAEMYGLLPFEDYEYLNKNGTKNVQGIDECEKFSELKISLTILGFEEEKIVELMRFVSSILLFGNIKFTKDESDSLVLSNEDLVEKISISMGIDFEKFKRVLLFKKMNVRGETTFIPIKEIQIWDNRDSIAKFIYNQLFQHLVDVINSSTSSEQMDDKYIGILDIFGFENFQINSFEQLCINYANEKLQQFFNLFIFKLEQEQYQQEGLDWTEISFNDNQPSLDVIEGKMEGILALLDEECKFPKGTDESFLLKLTESLGNKNRFLKPKTLKNQFGVFHYAGEVFYQVESFLEKNKDAVDEELFSIFENSSNQFVKEIFNESLNESLNVSSKKSSCGSSFKSQLYSLVDILKSTTPHYIRCIKPNSEKKAFEFNPEMVIGKIKSKYSKDQMRYSGMMETIQIRKLGYPYRFTVAEFRSRLEQVSNEIENEASSRIGGWVRTVLKKAIVKIQSIYRGHYTRVRLGFPNRKQNEPINENNLVASEEKHIKALTNAIRKQYSNIDVTNTANDTQFRNDIDELPELFQNDSIKMESNLVNEVANIFSFLDDFVVDEQKQKHQEEDKQSVDVKLTEISSEPKIFKEAIEAEIELQPNIISNAQQEAQIKGLHLNNSSVQQQTQDEIEKREIKNKEFVENYPIYLYAEKSLLIQGVNEYDMDAKIKAIQSILTYSKSIDNSLTISCSKIKNLAIETFKLINKICETKNVDDYLISINKLLQLIHENPDLSEEVYFQLIKQLNNTPIDKSNNYELHLWDILSSMCNCILPPKNMNKYVLSFLIEQLTGKGNRKFILNELEISQIIKNERTLVCIKTMDASSQKYAVGSLTTVSDLLEQILHKLTIRNVNGWGLVCQGVFVKGSEYVWDVFNKCDKILDFELKKRVILADQECESAEYNLLYYQTMKSYLFDEMLINEKLSLQLGGLKAQITFGDLIHNAKDNKTLLKAR